MCGIFGLTVSPDTSLKSGQMKEMTDALFLLSETRGREASGMAFHNGDKITVLKQPNAASTLIRSSQYRDLFAGDSNQRFTAIVGHSRLVTNGRQSTHDNNQPVYRNGVVAVHNGIIVNDKDLWSEFSPESPESELDSEILPISVSKKMKNGLSASEAIFQTTQRVKGTASYACLFEQYQLLGLATNHGSLFYAQNNQLSFTCFASELYILEQFVAKHVPDTLSAGMKAIQIQPTHTAIISLDKSAPVTICDGGNDTADAAVQTVQPADIVDISRLKDPTEAKLQRCTRCILPSTMPFITFDREGVCNYCHTYGNPSPRDPDSVYELADRIRSKNGEPDCVVAVSGGRDSCYGLHLIREELKLNPISFTYDWGMVTDLARRNQARVNGQLGIEHIIISADIDRKRRNIRANVEAWLKRPSLCAVPLFTAGDKQFYYYANSLVKRTGLSTMFFCENGRLEKTRFKSGFCGVDEKNRRLFNLSLIEKLGLAASYGKEYMLNPSYINRSLVDSISAFISAYFLNHDYVQLFEHLDWEEKTAEDILINQYGWELAPDATTTWRIGDGTAPFYNYIYYMVAGFTEHDTFRSNQIREGMITREEALARAFEDNQPRWGSIKWYTDTIGVDFDKAIRTINSIPRLYD